jgi:hypothetical protein
LRRRLDEIPQLTPRFIEVTAETLQVLLHELG